MTGEEQTPVDDRRATVLAVDDHSPFLALLRSLIGATRGLEVVGTAESGERALELAEELKPDMIVMDVRMPGLSGIEAARRIKGGCTPTVMVLISTTHPNELPAELDGRVADAVLWKNELQPKRLDEIWQRCRQ